MGGLAEDGRIDPSATPGHSAAAPITDAAAEPTDAVLLALGSSGAGLSDEDAAARLVTHGPNAVRSHHVRPLAILGRQLANAVLILLAVTAAVSFALGQRTDAVIIGTILLASVGLGFVNELQAERTVDALHSRVAHRAIVVREGQVTQVPVAEVVPGDIVQLSLGRIVPADIRLLDANGLECDESVLTGESLPSTKQTGPVASGAGLADLTSCALMGTVVRGGRGRGVVVATGSDAEFGRIALGLGDRHPETEFQAGLRRFSFLLLEIAAVLTTFVLVTNLLLHRPVIDALLFSLAIAVGITPQLLPAVVSSSLATGSRQLARRGVLVKRLVCIEDLGDMDVLVTDKTGTLTEGTVSFVAGLDPTGARAVEPMRLGLLANEAEPGTAGGAVGANPLDVALWDAAVADPVDARGAEVVALLPFDHDRRMVSVLVTESGGRRTFITKGAPETVLDRCIGLPAAATDTLARQFASGARVVAVATRDAAGMTAPTTADEQGLTLAGFLVFLDRPKAGAAESLRRLADLGITVKIATGDNAVVAEKVCADLGLTVGRTLTGADVDALDDDALAEAAVEATVLARVSPEQKARIVRLLRRRGRSVGFLGDGVNDALALHAADVGISVDSATDVAKDSADIVLLEKDLAVLAAGVAEGRRTFANTIKYVLMGTSSNFGNMFSAAVASAVLRFLPMLPSQILLNNLLYDASQLSIPTDNVDPEQLQAPSHWDIRFIRRFMLRFGPISSVFDFLTFFVMLRVLHAGEAEFHSGWFVESLATQTLIIFSIRTRRSPFTRSRPSRALLVTTLSAVTIGVLLPLSPFRHALGFALLPANFYLALVGMVAAYLTLIEVAKQRFFAAEERPDRHVRSRGRAHRVHRRASHFSYRGPIPPRSGADRPG